MLAILSTPAVPLSSIKGKKHQPNKPSTRMKLRFQSRWDQVPEAQVQFPPMLDPPHLHGHNMGLDHRDGSRLHPRPFPLDSPTLPKDIEQARAPPLLSSPSPSCSYRCTNHINHFSLVGTSRQRLLGTVRWHHCGLDHPNSRLHPQPHQHLPTATGPVAGWSNY